MFKRIFARMKGILMLFAGSIALLPITLMLDFKTFEQFNFYRDVDVWSHPILIVQLVMVVIVLLLLGQVVGLSVKYYFAFKKLDALFPNNEWEQIDFKEKADYVDEKFEAMIVKEVLIFYGSHFTVIPLKELKEIPNFKIPVVVLTANAIEGMKEKYLDAGFDDYLAKPIVKDELKRILTKFLN